VIETGLNEYTLRGQLTFSWGKYKTNQERVQLQSEAMGDFFFPLINEIQFPTARNKIFRWVDKPFEPMFPTERNFWAEQNYHEKEL